MIDYSGRLKKIEAVLFNALENNPQELAYPLAAPVKVLIQAGGKRWRPLLLVLCAELALDSDNAESAYLLTPLVEFVHTASLVHDDIEDSSDTRRGKPAAHISWGVDTALNAASWLYFKAAECIQTFDSDIKNQLYALYIEELRRLHLGQAMDIAWHKDKKLFPSVEDYLTMVHCKTGTLASLAAKAGMIAGGGQRRADAVGAAAAHLGAAFQILDDVTNLSTGNPGKKRGDDVVEGKKSYIILKHIETHPGDRGIISECFEQAAHEGITSPAVERLIAVVTGAGTLAASAQKAHEMISAACDDFAALAPEQEDRVKFITNLFMGMLP
jgi:octaprenyl-diphosphate synthase